MAFDGFALTVVLTLLTPPARAHPLPFGNVFDSLATFAIDCAGTGRCQPLLSETRAGAGLRQGGQQSRADYRDVQIDKPAVEPIETQFAALRVELAGLRESIQSLQLQLELRAFELAAVTLDARAAEIDRQLALIKPERDALDADIGDDANTLERSALQIADRDRLNEAIAALEMRRAVIGNEMQRGQERVRGLRQRFRFPETRDYLAQPQD